MSHVRITIGEATFVAAWEWERSPRACAAFRALLPFEGTLVHGRWSGEACWVPLGAFDLGVPVEHPTSRPRAGEILFYPRGISETEILVPYGETRFASVAGELAGSHLMTIRDGLERLASVGQEVWKHGSRSIRFEEEQG